MSKLNDLATDVKTPEPTMEDLHNIELPKQGPTMREILETELPEIKPARVDLASAIERHKETAVSMSTTPVESLKPILDEPITTQEMAEKIIAAAPQEVQEYVRRQTETAQAAVIGDIKTNFSTIEAAVKGYKTKKRAYNISYEIGMKELDYESSWLKQSNEMNDRESVERKASNRIGLPISNVTYGIQQRYGVTVRGLKREGDEQIRSVYLGGYRPEAMGEDSFIELSNKLVSRRDILVHRIGTKYEEDNDRSELAEIDIFITINGMPDKQAGAFPDLMTKYPYRGFDATPPEHKRGIAKLGWDKTIGDREGIRLKMYKKWKAKPKKIHGVDNLDSGDDSVDRAIMSSNLKAPLSKSVDEGIQQLRFITTYLANKVGLTEDESVLQAFETMQNTRLKYEWMGESSGAVKWVQDAIGAFGSMAVIMTPALAGEFVIGKMLTKFGGKWMTAQVIASISAKTGKTISVVSESLMEQAGVLEELYHEELNKHDRSKYSNTEWAKLKEDLFDDAYMKSFATFAANLAITGLMPDYFSPNGAIRGKAFKKALRNAREAAKTGLREAGQEGMQSAISQLNVIFATGRKVSDFSALQVLYEASVGFGPGAVMHYVSQATNSISGDSLSPEDIQGLIERAQEQARIGEMFLDTLIKDGEIKVDIDDIELIPVEALTEILMEAGQMASMLNAEGTGPHEMYAEIYEKLGKGIKNSLEGWRDSRTFYEKEQAKLDKERGKPEMSGWQQWAEAVEEIEAQRRDELKPMEAIEKEDLTPAEKLKQKANEASETRETISGETVANDINEMSRETDESGEDMKLSEYEKKRVSAREYKEESVDLNKLLETDPDVKAAHESREKDGGLASRYKGEDVSSESLSQPITVIDGELVDGYSRASELLSQGEGKATGYVAIPKGKSKLTLGTSRPAKPKTTKPQTPSESDLPGMRLKSLSVIENSMHQKMSRSEVFMLLKAKGVTAGEIADLKIKEWVKENPKGKVEQGDVLTMLKDKSPSLHFIKKEDKTAEANEIEASIKSKVKQYTNLAEKISKLEMKAEEGRATDHEIGEINKIKQELDSLNEEIEAKWKRLRKATPPEDDLLNNGHKKYSVSGKSENPENYANYREILVTDEDSYFVEEDHYWEAGIAFTVRGSDIVGDSETFLIDEIQSDVHQRGRTAGYQGKNHDVELESAREEINRETIKRETLKGELHALIENYIRKEVPKQFLIDTLEQRLGHEVRERDIEVYYATFMSKMVYAVKTLLAAKDKGVSLAQLAKNTEGGDPFYKLDEEVKRAFPVILSANSGYNSAIDFSDTIKTNTVQDIASRLMKSQEFSELKESLRRIARADETLKTLHKKVDETALKTSWIKAGLQTAIAEAVNNNRGEVSIATGFEQIERNFVKEVAKHYYSRDKQKALDAISNLRARYINNIFSSREAIKIMDSLDKFYNTRLPGMLKKFGNKHGAEVSLVENDDGVVRWTLKLNDKIRDQVKTKGLNLHTSKINEGESSRVPLTPTVKSTKTLLRQVKKRGVSFIEFVLGGKGSKGLENLKSKWNKEYSDPAKYRAGKERQKSLTMAKNEAKGLGFIVWLNRIIKNDKALTVDFTGAPVDLSTESGRKDFVLLTELMRSRNFEVGRTLFVKDGVILMSTDRTFGDPASTTVISEDMDSESAKEAVKNVMNYAKALACDEVIFLHNHPTSEVVPSTADLTTHATIQILTSKFNKLNQTNIKSTDITINHGMFSVMGDIITGQDPRVNAYTRQEQEKERLRKDTLAVKEDVDSLQGEESLDVYEMARNDLTVVRIKSVMGSVDRLLSSGIGSEAAGDIESDLAEFIDIPEKPRSAEGIVGKLENLADQGRLDGQDFAIAYVDPQQKLTGIVTVSYQSLSEQMHDTGFWERMRAEFGGYGILVPLNNQAANSLLLRDINALSELNTLDLLKPPADLKYGGGIATYGGPAIRVGADKIGLPVEASKISPAIKAFESLGSDTRSEMGYSKNIDIRKKGKRSRTQAENRLHEAAIHDVLIKAKELGLDVAKFRQWYSESISAMREQLVKDLPALAEQENMALFDIMLAVFSTKTGVAMNYDNAFDAMEHYLEAGELKVSKNKSNNDVLLNSKDKIIGGMSGKDMYITMSKIMSAIEEMGAGKLHQWLMRSDVSKQEFIDVFGKVPSGAMVGGNKGHLIFGPKVGEFYAAITGSSNALVIDRWVMYWAVRHLGVMTEMVTNKGRKVRSRIEAPNNKGTREVIKNAFSRALEDVNEATGESWTMAELQAVVWMLEKNIHANNEALVEDVNSISDFEAAALTREDRDGNTKLEDNGRGKGEGDGGLSVGTEDLQGQGKPAVEGTAQQITIETAQEIADAINDNGGFTYDPKTGEVITSVNEDTWAVGVTPELSHKAQAHKKITAEQVQTTIQEFIANSKKASPGLNDLFELDSGFKLGGWVNKEGVFFVDVTMLITESRSGGKGPAKLKAMQLAKEQNQQAIFNLNDFTEVDTGGTGEARPGINIVAEAKKLGNKYGDNTASSLEDDVEVKDSSGAQKLLDIAKRFSRTGRKSALGRAVEAVKNARDISRKLRKKSIADHVSNFYTKWLDPHWPAIRAVKKALKIQGKGMRDLAASSNPVILARTMMRWTAIADSFLRGKGVAKWDNANEYTSESLEKIMRPIKEKDIDAFNAYLIARRVIDLAETKPEGFVDVEVLAENEAVVEEALQAHPEWAELASKITAFSNAVLEYTKDAGLISEEEYGHLVEMHKNYVPLHVLAILDENGNPSSDYKDGTRVASVWKPISEIDENIVRVPPLESIIKNTHFLINLALENEFKKSIVDAVGDSAPEIVQHIADVVKGEHGVTVEQLEDIVDTEGMTDKQIAMVLKLSSARMIGDSGRIAILRDGVTEVYDVDPGIYHVLSNIAKSNTAPWMKFLAAMSGAKLLRTGAVLAPEFTIRNPLRDILGSSILGNFVLPLTPYHFMKALAQYVGNTDLFYQWINSGGSLGSMLGSDINEARREVLGSNEKKSQQEVYELKRSSLHGKKEYMLSASGLLQLINPVFWGKRGVGAIRTISEGAESVSRLSTYDRRLHALMKEVAKGNMTIRDAQLMAAFESVEGSIDFLRQGEWAADANRLWPFFSALLGGVDTTFKKLAYDPTGMTTKSHRAKVWGSGAMLAAASLFLWNQYKDDEEYKSIPLEIKLMAWPVKIGDYWWYIPKPFELGFIFATLPELFAQHVYDDEPGLIEDSLEGFLHTTLPSGLPFPIPVAIGQAAANYDMFYDAKIEGRTDETLPRHMRYSSNSSAIARELGAEAKKLRNLPLIGEAFEEGLSPKKIDFMIRGAGGGLARFAVQLISDGIRAAKPEIYGNAPSMHYIWWRVSAETPGITGLVDPAPLRRTVHVEKFYSYLNKARHTMGAMNSITSGGGTYDDMVTALAEDWFWVGAAGIMAEQAETMAEINGYISVLEHGGMIEKSSTMSPDERRDKIDELITRRNGLAKRVVEKIEEQHEKYTSDPEMMDKYRDTVIKNAKKLLLDYESETK